MVVELSLLLYIHHDALELPNPEEQVVGNMTKTAAWAKLPGVLSVCAFYGRTD